VVVFDEMADLGRDLGAIPSHNQHLANRPGWFMVAPRCQQLASMTCTQGKADADADAGAEAEATNGDAEQKGGGYVPVQILPQWIQVIVELGHVGSQKKGERVLQLLR
jgi:hypothetical protein